LALNRFYEWVGEELKKARLDRDLTLEDVAERLTLTKRHIKNYEDGDSKLPAHILIKLCDIYNIDYNDFVKRSTEYLD